MFYVAIFSFSSFVIGLKCSLSYTD